MSRVSPWRNRSGVFLRYGESFPLKPLFCIAIVNRMTGPELLKSWRTLRGLNQTAAAEELELSQSALCEYEAGKKVPRVVAALRMSRKTGGFVPVESWDSLEDS